jgi:hypothetical protein
MKCSRCGCSKTVEVKHHFAKPEIKCANCHKREEAEQQAMFRELIRSGEFGRGRPEPPFLVSGIPNPPITKLLPRSLR